jgi:ubiquinone/menaquinone biosynthesis C-methylase UbiE
VPANLGAGMPQVSSNVDLATVEGFGQEWAFFDQAGLDQRELREIFDSYFEIFPWPELPKNPVGFDLGCGSGRWAQFVAPRVGFLHLIDASDAALSTAVRRLEGHANCAFHVASVDCMPLEEASIDFGYCLGVLHHVPDTEGGIRACVAKLKPGAPFLLYLYYAFDNRPPWFRALWRMSDWLRRVVCKLPFSFRVGLTTGIAAAVYWPLARLALILDKLGLNANVIPLSAYRNRSFYTMRTDALDRFGTRLEKRFSAEQVREMMERSGLEDVRFSSSIYWCAVGRKGTT